MVLKGPGNLIFARSLMIGHNLRRNEELILDVDEVLRELDGYAE